MMKFLYQTLWRTITPIAPIYLLYRTKIGKQQKQYSNERYGNPRHSNRHSICKQNQKLLWGHAASVGEINSIIPLIEFIQQKHPKKYQFLITTSSQNGQKIIQKYISNNNNNNNLFCQYLPLDHPKWVQKFLNHYKPYAALWIEQEIWPNILFAAHKQGVRLALINGRLTEKSTKKWLTIAPTFAKNIAQLFQITLAQSPKDQKNLQKIGFNAQYYGNIKAQTKHNINTQPNNKISKIIPENKICWLAASIHKGEDTICLKAHSLIKENITQKNKPLLILVPRYPEQANAMTHNAEALGLTTKIYSKLNAKINDDDDVLVIDTLGILPMLYGNSKAAFIGGSSGQNIIGSNFGGHNPLEAVAQNCCVLYGKDMRNFSYTAEALNKAGGSIVIEVAVNSLFKNLKVLLNDTQQAKNMQIKASKVLKALSAEAQACFEVIDQWLEQTQ